MKVTNYFVLFTLMICFAQISIAQADHDAASFSYGVEKIHPYISVTTEEVKQADRLIDLNSRYKPEWVKEYYEVVVTTCSQGHQRTATGNSNLLTPAQKLHLRTADAGTEVKVYVRYLPNNNLANNEIKELDFTFVPTPPQDATFPAGATALQQYLTENAIAEIPPGTFQGYQMAAVKFTVSTTGEIIDAHVFESSGDTRLDAIFLNTVKKMSAWEPARYPDGTLAAQEFAFVVGNMESCVINLLSINRHP